MPMPSPPEPIPDCPPQVSTPREDVEVGSSTHEGKVRDNNEDAAVYFEAVDSELFESKGRLLVLADGMGGHLAGEVASRVAVESLRDSYVHHPSDESETALRESLIEANNTVYRRGLENEDEKGMGTTCTALVHRGNEVFIGHVGDSRAYLIRSGAASQLTTDHATPQGLLRALGAEESVEVEMCGPLTTRNGDAFVLCSDGLTRYLDGIDIRNALDGSRSAQEACETLIRRTLEEGAIDNVTVQILKIRNRQRDDSGSEVEILNDTQPLPPDTDPALPQDTDPENPDSTAPENPAGQPHNVAQVDSPAQKPNTNLTSVRRDSPKFDPIRVTLLIVIALLVALVAIFVL